MTSVCEKKCEINSFALIYTDSGMRDLECSFLPSETVVMAEELPSCALQLSVHSQSSQGGEDEAEVDFRV